MPPQKPHLAPTIQIFTSVDSQYTCEFDKNEIMLDFTPMNAGLQGYVWRVPSPKDGGLSIANGIVDFRIYRNKPRANMKKIFCRELRSRNIHQGLPSWSSHPIHWLSNEDIISQPNVILVGDAAGIEPAFGGGIHISLSYGELAAFSIMDAFQNNDFSFHDYKKRLQSHLVGRTIRECSHLAREMYGGRMNPIKVARELFTAKYERLNLLSLLLPKLSFYP
jgi:flavin-dependent dehydrogenase